MNEITVTGIDIMTPIREVQKLDAEIGILYSGSNRENRYPPLAWIADVSKYLKRVAIHVCGRGAREDLLATEISDEVEHAQRIQVNGFLELKTVEEICRLYPRHQIITQHRPENVHLLAVKAVNHCLLVDGSGGRGKLPEKWSRPETGKRVGFAGGLGPFTLDNELIEIKKVGAEDFWIDMEGQIRDGQDWFDIEKAKLSIAIFKAYTLTPPPTHEETEKKIDWRED